VGIKILLADDSVTAQNMGKKILSEAGHEVVTVSNGAAAAKKIAEIKPELVLLDVFMPGYSGLELCERLRNAAETSKMPVLLTVGRMEPYNAQDGARVKADGVIVKPFEATDLTAAVDRLAEKLHPAKGGDAARGMKIVARSESKMELEAEVKSAPAPDAAPAAIEEPKPYEQTVRLHSAQVHAMLQQGEQAAQEEAADKNHTTNAPVSPAAAAHEFHIAPPISAAEVDSFESAVRSGATPESSSIASFMSQYLPSEDAAEAKRAEKAAPESAPDASIHDQPTGAFPIHNEFLISHSHAEAAGITQQQKSEPASTPGLEYTLAPPASEMPVASEPGLELTRQSAASESVVVPDPALETDPHRAATDFPTQFGSNSDLANEFMASLQSPPQPAMESADEFEARLNAAMAAYEEPAADLPTLIADANTAIEASHLEPGFDSGTATDSFEAQVEAAMHSFDSPEASIELSAPTEVAETFSSQIESVAPTSDFEISSVAQDSPAEAQQEPTVVDLVSHTALPVLADQPQEIMPDAAEFSPMAAPETDETVIERMREGLSHLPLEPVHIEESVESAPMAMAAAAAPAAAQASALPHNAEVEIERAMAAAMGRESSQLQSESAAVVPPADGPAEDADANHLAGAVEKVMKRELPNLIGKIMAELDLRKRT